MYGAVFVCVMLCVWSTAAFEYMKSHPVGQVDEEEFSQYCGVGVVITLHQIQEQVHVQSCIYLYVYMYMHMYMYTTQGYMCGAAVHV